MAGWTLDDVLALTWDQLEVVTTCVVEYRALQMNTVLEVVAQVMGGKVNKPGRTKRRRPSSSPRHSTPRSRRKQGPSTADRFAAAGIPVSTKRS